MARLEQDSKSGIATRSRYFSDDFKRKKVEEIDRKLVSVSEVSRIYEVSPVAVYKWIYKFSLMKKKGIKVVVEADSDTVRIKALKQHVAQLEQLLGQKQFELDFLEKQMQLASEQYGIDLKKKPSGNAFTGSGNSENNTATE